MGSLYLTLGNERRFTFTSTAVEPDTFAVVDLKGTEAISPPYEFMLTLVTENQALAFETVLDQPATPTIHSRTGAPSQFCITAWSRTWSRRTRSEPTRSTGRCWDLACGSSPGTKYPRSTWARRSLTCWSASCTNTGSRARNAPPFRQYGVEVQDSLVNKRKPYPDPQRPY